MARYTILNGPSKFDLVVSLAHGDSHNRHRVAFMIREEDSQARDWEESVVIHRLERKDDPGEIWDFFGTGEQNYITRASYSTQTRKGWLEDDS